MNKITLLLAICFVQLYAMDEPNKINSNIAIGPKADVAIIEINYDKIDESLKESIRHNKKHKEAEREKQLTEEQSPNYINNLKINLSKEIDRSTDLQKQLTNLKKEHAQKIKHQNEQAEKEKKALEEQIEHLKITNDRFASENSDLMAREYERFIAPAINAMKDTGNFVVVSHTDLKKQKKENQEKIDNLENEVTKLKMQLIDNQAIDNIHLDIIKKRKEQAQIKVLNSMAEKNHNDSITQTRITNAQVSMIETEMKSKHHFWLYMQRPEVIFGLITVFAPPLIKLFANKESFPDQSKILELQKKRLENRKTTIEIASAEDDLMKKRREQEKEALKFDLIKTEFKVSTWLTELVAQEANGKKLTPAELEKKQRCIQLLETIKATKEQQYKGLVAQQAIPAA